MSLFAASSDERITDPRQLAAYFAKGEKPKTAWRIGTEHEKFPYYLDTLRPVPYEGKGGLAELLTAFQDYGWKPIEDKGAIIGLTRGSASITLEPGGQFELSGAPLGNLHETSAEINDHIQEACDVAGRFNIGFLGMGFHPTARRDDLPWVPKSRYELMRRYMPQRGQMGHDMMLRTCTVQVNLDYADEADMVQKFRLSLALQPLATALFACSPFQEGKPSGYNSSRMNVWTDTDPDRCGAIPFVLEDGFGYERYAQYALDVPMYFVYRDGTYIDCLGQSFRDFLQGRLPALPGEVPTVSDWTNHLSTLFPDVRLKTYLEMRGADMGSVEMAMALPAFWVGLLYDQGAMDSAWEAVKGWSAEDRRQLHADVPRLGLQVSVAGRTLQDLGADILTIARNGLRRRAQRLYEGVDESRYLDPLFEIIDCGQNRSDFLMMQQQHFSDFDWQKLFAMGRLLPQKKANSL